MKILTKELKKQLEDQIENFGREEQTKEALEILEQKVGKKLTYMDAIVVRQFIEDSNLYQEVSEWAVEEDDEPKFN